MPRRAAHSNSLVVVPESGNACDTLYCNDLQSPSPRSGEVFFNDPITLQLTESVKGRRKSARLKKIRQYGMIIVQLWILDAKRWVEDAVANALVAGAGELLISSGSIERSELTRAEQFTNYVVILYGFESGTEGNGMAAGRKHRINKRGIAL